MSPSCGHSVELQHITCIKLASMQTWHQYRRGRIVGPLRGARQGWRWRQPKLVFGSLANYAKVISPPSSCFGVLAAVGNQRIR